MYPDYGPAVGVPFIALNLVFTVGVYIWLALALSAVFRKAGIAPWKAWVPVVNTWTLFTLGGVAGWWAIVLIVLSVVPALVTGIVAGIAVASADSGLLLVGGLVGGVIGIVVLVVTILLLVKVMRGVNAGFGLGTGHVILGVLLVPVWASIVGWGSARWIGPPVASSRQPAQPNLTPPPPPSAPSPFTLSGLAAAEPSAHPHPSPVLPAAGSYAPAFGAVPAPPAPPAPAPAPLIQGNPWAPPPPPSAQPAAPAPAPEPAAAPAPVTASPVIPDPVPVPTPARAVAASPVSAVVAPAAPVAAVPASAPVPAPVAADDLDERTVLAARRQAPWTLLLPDGRAVTLTAETVVLGRNPAAPAGAPDAQLIPVDDVSRTVSKTHASLQRTATGWILADLASTNGVFLPGADGEDVEVQEPVEVTGAFLLGDAVVTLRAEN